MKKNILASLTLIFISLSTYGQGRCEELYQAVSKNDKDKVHQLLNERVDANCVKSAGPWMKVSMLITAVNNKNIEIVKALLDHKADVNWKDGFQTTALMYAASDGNKGIVSLLLDYGADVNVNDGQGNTVLSAAKESKDKKLIKFIEAKLKQK